MNPQTDTPESAEAMTERPICHCGEYMDTHGSDHAPVELKQYDPPESASDEELASMTGAQLAARMDAKYSWGLTTEAARRLRQESDTALKLQRCEEALRMAEHDRRKNHWRSETSVAISKALEASK